MGIAEFSAGRRTLLALLLAALAFLCVWILQPFITPILWAAILAYASWPLYGRLRQLLRGWQGVAALLMTLFLGCAVVVPVLWILVVLQHELTTAYQWLTHYLAAGPPQLPAWMHNLPWIGDKLQEVADQYSADPQALTEQLGEWVKHWSTQLGGVLGGVGRNVVKLTLTLITLFFFFRDGEAIVSEGHGVIRRFFDDRLNAYVVTAVTMARAVVYGTLITALTQGLIAGIGYWIIGFGTPGLLGVLTFLLSVVPLVGTAIVWVPVGLWALATGHVLKGIILLAWGAMLVHPADQVLRPILISNATRVPFLLVMFGALGGLTAFGLLGLFIGPVVLAVAMSIWREWSLPVQP